MVASFTGCTDRGCGKQTAHVLDDDELRAEPVDRFGHVRPEPGSGARDKAYHLPDRRDILTGEPAADDVHWLDRGPVHLGNVAEIWGVRPVAGEDVPDRADLRKPDRLRLEDVFDGEIEAAVTREQ